MGEGVYFLTVYPRRRRDLEEKPTGFHEARMPGVTCSMNGQAGLEAYRLLWNFTEIWLLVARLESNNLPSVNIGKNLANSQQCWGQLIRPEDDMQLFLTYSQYALWLERSPYIISKSACQRQTLHTVSGSYNRELSIDFKKEKQPSDVRSRISILVTISWYAQLHSCAAAILQGETYMLYKKNAF